MASRRNTDAHYCVLDGKSCNPLAPTLLSFDSQPTFFPGHREFFE